MSVSHNPPARVPSTQCYDPVSHPDVASGRMSPDEALNDLASAMVSYQQGGGDDSRDEVGDDDKINTCDLTDVN